MRDRGMLWLGVRGCRFLLRFLAAWLLVLQAHDSVRAQVDVSDWHYANRDNITILTNADPSLIHPLDEEIRIFLHEVNRLLGAEEREERWPVRIILCRDRDTFIALAPENPKFASSVAGYFNRGLGHHLIVIQTNTTRNRLLEVLYHELVHRVLEAGNTVPLWYNEGLAEFYSGFRLRNNRIEFGLVHRRHLRWVNRFELTPLNRFFRVHHGSSEYNETHLSGAFYATAWLFAHYCLLGEPERYRDAFHRFAARSLAPAQLEQDFIELFEVDFAQMETELRRYARRFRHPRIRLRHEPTEVVQALQVRKLESDETATWLASVLALSERVEEARTLLFEHSGALPDTMERIRFDPERQLDDPTPLHVHLKLAYLTEDYPKAYQLAEQAFRAGDRAPIVLLTHAEALLNILPGQRFDSRLRLPVHQVNEAFNCINRLLRLDSHHRQTLRLYAIAWTRTDAIPSTWQVHRLREHCRRAPSDRVLHLITAELFAILQRPKEAEEVLEAFLNASENMADRLIVERHLTERRNRNR